MKDGGFDTELVAAAVRAAQQGDSSAFDVVVRAYQQKAVTQAYRYVGRLEDAKDVAQDSFVRAYLNLSQLKEPGSFSSWFLRIVTNLALNYRRSRALRMTEELDETGEGAGTTSSPDPADSVEDQLTPALREEIRSALQRLPDRHRETLTLFVLGDLPQKEVAERLNMSVGMVKFTVFEAKKKLKDLLVDVLDSCDLPWRADPVTVGGNAMDGVAKGLKLVQEAQDSADGAVGKRKKGGR